MSNQRWWLMRVGPASVAIATHLPLGGVAHASSSAGCPPIYQLEPIGRDCFAAADATLVHLYTRGTAHAEVDIARNHLRLRAGDGAVGPSTVLHLAYLLLESQLQRLGYVTLHASAIARGGQGVLLLGHPGAGKTMTALRLCREYGCRLIGNDLCVVGGAGANPLILAGSAGIRLRLAAVRRDAPDLVACFPRPAIDTWRTKVDVAAARLGIHTAGAPVELMLVAFVHTDGSYPRLLDAPGDTLVHRLNLYENALRYIRGGSTPWLVGPGYGFGPYLPPLDHPELHCRRTATLTRLLVMSRYLAGPLSPLADRISAYLDGVLTAGAPKRAEESLR